MKPAAPAGWAARLLRTRWIVRAAVWPYWARLGLLFGSRLLMPEHTGLLAEKGTALGGPWSDHLEGAVWELRIRLHQVAVRVTYWCRPDGVIVLLTVFRKTRQHEQRQNDRAVRAQQA